MLFRKLSAAAAVLGASVLAGPVGVASADTTATPPLPQATAFPLLSFVPPYVGPIRVNIGPTIIGGKQISAGVNVLMPGVTLPPLTWSPPK